MLHFDEIYSLACKKVGGAEALQANLPQVLSAAALCEKTDDRYLSDMSRRVFQAGLSWKMVNNKWPAFEAAFFQFNPRRCAFINNDEIAVYLRNRDLIRHLSKIKAVVNNATMIEEIKRSHTSFGEYLAQWPETEIIALWADLKKRGDRLGGMSAAMFLRISGKDTFVLSDDVVAALINFKQIDQKPTSKKVLAEVQQHFNCWQQQSGRPMAEISRMLAFLV